MLTPNQWSYFFRRNYCKLNSNNLWPLQIAKTTLNVLKAMKKPIGIAKWAKYMIIMDDKLFSEHYDIQNMFNYVIILKYYVFLNYRRNLRLDWR